MTTQANVRTLTASEAAADTALWAAVARGEATVTATNRAGVEFELSAVYKVKPNSVLFLVMDTAGDIAMFDLNSELTVTPRNVDVSEDWETWKESYYHLKAVSELERQIAANTEAEIARLQRELAAAQALLDFATKGLESIQQNAPQAEPLETDTKRNYAQAYSFWYAGRRAADVLARIRGNGEAG